MRAALALFLVASLAGATSDFTIVAGPTRSAERIGPYRFGVDPSYAAAVKAFGQPTSLAAEPPKGVCIARWAKLGLAIRFGPEPADPCAPASSRRITWAGATVSSRIWRTAAGLRVGDAVARLRRLYPAARSAGGGWLLVYRRGEVGLTVYLQAHVRVGRVTALDLPPGNVSVARS